MFVSQFIALLLLNCVTSTVAFGDTTRAAAQKAIITVVDEARSLGPVANDEPEDKKEAFLSLARQLQPLSDPQPARLDFTGNYERLYSVSPGKKLGLIQQKFLDRTNVVNSVALGPLKTTSYGRYKATGDFSGTIVFEKLVFSVFGLKFYEKPYQAEGLWKILFVGTFVDHDGVRKRLRVMETPTLFLLLQNLEA
mmetsp:Transcript_16653/g.23143  ORF Transcript_16653/g.23143 Transcript_16653/m.23143 type:complete len:195 (-) Transcript_16653:165-749(-)